MSKEDSLKDLLQDLAEQRGFDFRGYKRTTLERRLRKRMFQLHMGSYAEYGEYIRQHPDEINQLLNTILINVTEFFRDPPAWEVLRNEILAPILKKLKPGSSFRVWSAGCASGEEPYSVAILLAEHFGPRINEYDVKIYGTDIDEEELTIARRGEYSAEAVKRVRAEWRDKYFFGKGTFRINRELRKLVIFGKSNLAQHAPISHVDLLLCRNVLIYFDATLQKHILSRLHYALEPGGILFLGRSESQLTNSVQFQRLNGRWRIFRRLDTSATIEPRVELTPAGEIAGDDRRSQEEVVRLRLHQRYLMESLRAGAIILGADDTIVQHNNAILSLYGLSSATLSGKRLQDTDIPMRTPELVGYLTATLAKNESARFQSRLRIGAEERLLDFTMRPLVNERGERTGTLIYCEDGTVQEKLQTTIEELESTTEELQSANEELETTNEELQSTNEELETTNEELQSTNEELETTNEELQSLNEELETTNQELEERTKELDQLNSMYAQTLEKIRMPVMLVNPEGKIDFWNTMALRLFGFRSKPPVELQLDQLPLPEPLRKVIIRRHRMVLAKREPMVARNLQIGGRGQAADVHFSVIPQENKSHSVLLMFEPREDSEERGTNASGARRHGDGDRRK
jgi:two-component system CheB/CheR fusion protein